MLAVVFEGDYEASESEVGVDEGLVEVGAAFFDACVNDLRSILQVLCSVACVCQVVREGLDFSVFG